MLFYIYPIVAYATTILQSFLLLVTVVNGIGPNEASSIFLLIGTGIFNVLHTNWPLSFFFYLPFIPIKIIGISISVKSLNLSLKKVDGL